MGTTLDSVSKSGSRKGRPNYSAEFKQQIVAAACEPGASVSKLAMAHQLNANMVFRWRRELGAKAAGVPQVSPELLPIVLKHQSDPGAPWAPDSAAGCRIDVMIGDARVTVVGMPDEAALRAVFRSLRP
jgi:transposase